MEGDSGRGVRVGGAMVGAIMEVDDASDDGVDSGVEVWVGKVAATLVSGGVIVGAGVGEGIDVEVRVMKLTTTRVGVGSGLELDKGKSLNPQANRTMARGRRIMEFLLFLIGRPN